LLPPVDLGLVAESYADLEVDAIPGRCDGLVVGLHGPRERPLILLKESSPHRRRRFTLAHELGHVLLPWHIGDYACATYRVFDEERYHAALAEAQANRFAAHLLVPAGWLGNLIEKTGDQQIAPLMEAVYDAQVSPHVACLRLVTTLPTGHAFVMTEQDGTVLLSGQSSGTGVNPPRRGERLDRTRLDRMAMQVEEIRYGLTSVVWWSYRGDELPEDATEPDARTSREVLDGLLLRHAGSQEHRLRLSFGGIIGAANGAARREGVHDRGSLYAFFRSRFAKERSIPDEMLDDRDFDVWLRKRAEELGD
jgi:hypothetical protein